MRGTDISTNLRETAHSLMKRGVPVFLLSNDKIPYRNCADCTGQTSQEHRDECDCLRNGGLCHGFYAATTEIDTFDEWLELHPDAQNLAMPTGQTTGVFVFEYDPGNGGDTSYNELAAEHGAFNTHTILSPSGGYHFHFQMTNYSFGNIHGQIWPGIDIKGTGGYALIPPSTTEKGKYVTIDHQEPQVAPKWLLDKIFEYQSRNKWDNEAHMLRRQEQRAYDPDAITPEQADHVRKTVAYWQSRIKTAPDGKQNMLIYTGSRVLFSLCFHGLLDEEDAQLYLEEACEAGGHPPHRSYKVITSGRNAADSAPDSVNDALSNDIDILETFDQDDLGNANRVIFWRGTDMRYDPDRERFYTWAGKKWVHARSGRVTSIVEDVHSKIISTEAPFYSGDAIPPSEKDKKAPKSYRERFVLWAKAQRYSSPISSTVAILKGRESLWCTSEDFDVDPYHFNVSNGVVDLRTGQLLEHNREFMCSNISKDLVYDQKATCPEFMRFLDMAQPNPVHRKYLQRLIGYTMIGEVIDQVFAVHIGTGGNGKGVFLDIISYILGEYATAGQRDSFVRKSNSNRIPADIASMEGKRIVVVDELNENQKLDEALLKDITGGGIVKAEAKNVNPWEYTPKFTLHFRTNHMPDLPSDRSIVRRFRPVKWTVEPSSDAWDTFTSPHHSTPYNYLTKLEAPGILNWILEGTRDYLENGLQVPDDLSIEAVDMLTENDPFLIFMKLNLVANAGDRLDGSKLYGSYKSWYEDNGFSGNPPSSRSVYKDIREGKYKDRWDFEEPRGRFTLVGYRLEARINGHLGS